MDTNTESNKVDGLVGIEIDTFRHVNKNKREWVAAIVLNGDTLPLIFTGSSTENAKEKAISFYRDHLLNTVNNYSFVKIEGEDHEAQLMMLEGFSNVPKLPNVVYVKKDPNTDMRKVKGKEWVYKIETKHRIKVWKEEVETYLANGYAKGRGPEWDADGIPVPVKGKRVCVTEAADYVHPFKDKIWVNNGVQRLRVHKDDEAHYLSQGYVKGRGKLSDAPIEVPSIEEPVARDFATTDEQWNKIGEIDAGTMSAEVDDKGEKETV